MLLGAPVDQLPWLLFQAQAGDSRSGLDHVDLGADSSGRRWIRSSLPPEPRSALPPPAPSPGPLPPPIRPDELQLLRESTAAIPAATTNSSNCARCPCSFLQCFSLDRLAWKRTSCVSLFVIRKPQFCRVRFSQRQTRLDSNRATPDLRTTKSFVRVVAGSCGSGHSCPLALTTSR